MLSPHSFTYLIPDLEVVNVCKIGIEYPTRHASSLSKFVEELSIDLILQRSCSRNGFFGSKLFFFFFRVRARPGSWGGGEGARPPKRAPNLAPRTLLLKAVLLWFSISDLDV